MTTEDKTPGTEEPVGATGETVSQLIEDEHAKEDHRAPGTMALTLLLLVSFAVYYFANWLALSDVWHVR